MMPKHSERCQDCKNNIKNLLQAIACIVCAFSMFLTGSVDAASDGDTIVVQEVPSAPSASNLFQRLGSQPGNVARAMLFGSEKKRQEPLVALLREHSDFNRNDASDIEFTYDYDHPKLTELKDKYDLENVAGAGDTQSKVLNLLNWLGNGTHHNGMSSPAENNALALLEYSYNQGVRKGINCRSLSITLSEMYLSVGIQARALWLFPHNPKDMDNHVVVMAYIPEKEKWIMVDPSWNVYFLDEEGEILSPLEVRERMVSGGTLRTNRDAKNEEMGYITYMAKDMFFFLSVKDTYYGGFDEDRTVVYLCPQGFDPTEWQVENMYFRSSLFARQTKKDELAEKENAIRRQQHVFATPESFWRK